MRTTPETLDKAIACFKFFLNSDPGWETVSKNLFIFETIRAYPEFEDQLLSLTTQQKLGLLAEEMYLNGCYSLAKDFISTKEN